MYRIAICEDEKVFLESLEKNCRKTLYKMNVLFGITLYNNSADLRSAYVNEGKCYDLVLLDIIMDGVDGMKLAHIIREYDAECSIVFVTSTREYAEEGYEVKALRYLRKPIIPEVLEKIIVSDYKERFQKNYIAFETKEHKVRILVKDIVYMEITGRKVAINLMDGAVIYYPGKLSDLLAQLPVSMFIRCHQGFAININEIKEFDRKTAITSKGQHLPISRNCLKNVREIFIKTINS